MKQGLNITCSTSMIDCAYNIYVSGKNKYFYNYELINIKLIDTYTIDTFV